MINFYHKKNYKLNIAVRLTALVLLLMLMVFATACNTSSGADRDGATGDADGDSSDTYEGLVIRIATQPSQIQPALAEELGFFEEEFAKDGITVEVKTFASGPPIIEAITAGELDFGQVGDQPALQAAANGTKIKIIGAYMSHNGSGSGLVARKDSGIKTLEDLKGKKVGYPVGTVAHHLLLEYLNSIELTEDDLQLVNLTIGDIYTALEAGNIDAGVSWEPYLTGSLASENLELIVNGVGYKASSSIIVGTSSFIDQYPELTVRLLSVLDKTAKWSDENQEESIRILAERTGIEETSFAASFEKYNFQYYLDEERIESIRKTADFLLDQGTIRQKVNVDELIDTTFLEQAGITK